MTPKPWYRDAMPTTPPADEFPHATTIRLDTATHEWLRRESFERNTPQVQIIRDALYRYITGEHSGATYPPVDKSVDNNVMASAIEVPDAS